jgi:hypothetical protein
MEGFDIGAALQTVLTRGLDYATARANSRLQINDPTPSVTGANGQRVAVGQPAAQPGIAGALAGVPTWAWIGGALLAGVAVAALLRR